MPFGIPSEDFHGGFGIPDLEDEWLRDNESTQCGIILTPKESDGQMNIYVFKLIRPANNNPGYVQINEIKIQAFYYEVALKRALLEAHKFAIENNIPYYRVEGEM